MKDGLRREYEILTLSVAVWHVLEYEHFKVDPSSHGQFHEGDTYVIRWQYMTSLTGTLCFKTVQLLSLVLLHRLSTHLCFNVKKRVP